MSFIKNPKAIEEKSMDIIDELLGPVNFTSEELAIIKRIVHTTGDPEYARLVKIHPEAIAKGKEALRNGASIFTDVRMIQAGVNSRVLSEFGGEIYCDIASDKIHAEAKKAGLTRALTSFRQWGPRLDGNIIAIGNAPTALFEVLRLAEEENIRPALVVGIPVGFVGAKESKDALISSDLPYITIPGTKGGSTITVATLNALLYLIKENRWD